MERPFPAVWLVTCIVVNCPYVWAIHQTNSPPKKPAPKNAATKPNVPKPASASELMEALESENVLRALNLVNRGADPNALSENRGQSALSLAASLGSRELVQALLSRGAKANPADPETAAPLTMALSFGHEPIARLLVENGADVNAGDGGAFEPRPLVLAAANGWGPLVTLMIDKGANVGHVSEDGITALAGAAEGGHVSILELLVGRGAKIEGDALVVLKAVSSGSVPALEFLLSRGRSLTAEKPLGGTTLLHLAAGSGNGAAMLARLLRESAFDINAPNGDGLTPLMVAASARDLGAVKFLLANKAPADTLDYRYRTALDVAEEMQEVDEQDPAPLKSTLAALKSAGAKLAPPSLWRAAVYGDKKQLRSLLDAGADPNEPDIRGAVPLFYIISDFYGRDADEMIALLLAKGANPNAKAPDGRPLSDVARDGGGGNDIVGQLRRSGALTPELDLTEAVERGDTIAVDALLEQGIVPESAALVYAVFRNDLKLLSRLLDKGAKVNAPVRLPNTYFGAAPDFALHAAVTGGNLAAVRLLLERGADPNIHTTGGPVPLDEVFPPQDPVGLKATLVAEDGPAADAVDGIVRLLVEHGADVRARQESGETKSTILPNLVSVAPVKTLEFVLDKGAAVDINKPQSSNLSDLTPLRMAVRAVRPKVVRLLLGRGANPGASDKGRDGGIILEAAYLKETPESLEVVRLLLEGGARADISDTLGRNPVQLAEEEGNFRLAALLKKFGGGEATISPAAAMSRAIYSGDTEAALRLLKDGFDPDGILPGGAPVLYEAAFAGDERLTQALLDKGADVKKKWSLGTPLHGAANSGEAGLVRLLLARGAEIDANDGYQGTPLAQAAAEGHVAVIRLLLKAGADPNARRSDHQGGPLSLAVTKGHEEAIELLLKAGADPNLGNPLPVTLWLGSIEMLERLVRAGANVNAQDPRGRTILMEAAALGNKEFLVWLIAHKADVNIKDKQGKTALAEALDRDNNLCAALLRKVGAK